MEVNQETIESVAKVLMMVKFNQAMKTVSDYMQIAKELMEQYPDLTPEEIGQEYEKMCEREANEKDAQEANSKATQEDTKEQENPEELESHEEER